MNDRPFVRWAALALALVLGVPDADATSYNSPDVDGTPPSTGETNADPSWQSDELLFEDPVGDSAWGPFNDLHGLWVTWDADGLYVAVQGALWDRATGVGANSANLYIDVDYGRGTGIGDLSLIDANALNAVSRNFWRPLTIGAGFGADWGYTCWAGRFDLGFLDIRDPQAPINLFQGVDGSSTPVHTSPEGVIEARDQAGNRGYELFIPWQVFYPDEPTGRVPAGTRIAFAVAQVGGGDSLSPESIPDGAEARAIEAPVVFPVDANGDGIPDRDFPPSGSIAGTVTLSDPLDTTTVVEVVVRRGAIELGRARTPAGGGDYLVDRLGPGEYSVEVDSPNWCADPTVLTLGENEDRTGIDFLAESANSGVDLSLVFVDGPQATSRTLSVRATLVRPSDGRVFEETVFAAGDAMVLQARVCPGTYRLRTESFDPAAPTALTGYVDLDLDVVIGPDEIVDLGALPLRLVQPTRLVIREDSLTGAGGDLRSVRIPSSVPAEEFYVRVPIEILAVDELGHEALLDPVLRNAITIRMTSIDPRWPYTGRFDLWTLDDDSMPVAQGDQMPSLLQLTPTETRSTRAGFRISGDTRQAARLRVTHPTLATDDLEIQISARLADSIDLQATDLQLVAGESTALRAQLRDVIGNPLTTEGLVLSFTVEPDAGGRAGVVPAALPTDANGTVGIREELLFRSTTAGTFDVRASVFNGVVTVNSDSAAVLIEVLPAPQDRLRLVASITGLSETLVRLQVTDEYDNPVTTAPREIAVTVGPEELVVDPPSTVSLDAMGFAEFSVQTRPGLVGVLQIAANDPALPNPLAETTLQLIPGLVGFDEPAPESDPLHNSLPGVDLTALAAQIVDGEFVFNLPFASDWGGLHFGLLLEVNQTPTGALGDAFGFPISYAHEFLPDFLFTYKYSDGDYGDLRRPGAAPGAWQWHNWTTGGWADAFEDGVNAVAQQQVSKTTSEVSFRIPINVLAVGFRPGVDTLRAQVYLMQEEGSKRPAFDSIPQDATLDMMPEGFDWFEENYLANNPTTLTQYVTLSPTLVGNTLAVESVTFSPTTTTQGESLLITASPGFTSDPPANPIYQLFANLSPLGGSASARMNDEGNAGDVAAGDGIYSVQLVVPTTQFAGAVDIVVQALELTTSQQVFATGSIEVIGDPELVPIISAVDFEGDDHGPNQPGVKSLYYEYPTNGVFFDGVFDLRRLDVFDLGDRLLFRLTIGDITDPNETSAADWGALYPSDNTCPEGQRTDLNLQNAVILIDSKDRVNVGSTLLPSNRYADVVPQDAWEYAMVFDGWWKGFVKSNGSSSSGAWSVVSADQSFYFCASEATNTIDGFISKSQFEEAELAAILNWDIIVMMSGHDGNSDQNNWGSVRWVNDGNAEWQFGGGRNSEGGRDRDPNIVDLLLAPGLDASGEVKPLGRPQEEQLDYLTPPALARFGAGKTSVELEITTLVDDIPPTVSIRGASAARTVVPNPILQDSPVVLRTNIFDESGVESASLFWWAPGEDPGQRREVALGRPRADLEPGGTEWVADLRWEDIAAATGDGQFEDPEDLASRVRFIYVTFNAIDINGNSTADLAASDPVVYELPTSRVTRIDYDDLLARAVNGAVTVDLSEGSRLVFPEDVLRATLPDSNATLDLTLRTIPQAELHEGFRSETNESVLGPDNRFLGIARRLELRAISGGDTTLVEKLAGPAQLSLHFPRYEQEDDHPGRYSLFRYNERTDRWILASGHGEPDGSTVTLETDQLGSFALFINDAEIDVDQYVTGLVVTPNPFTPNGDGLYDETHISYVLPSETAWAIVEIYDLRGERVRILQKFVADEITNRTLGITWDGKDEGGRTVPMGIYVVRVEVQSATENFEFSDQRRVERAMRAVAVVR